MAEATHHRHDLEYIGGRDIHKTYEDLDGWFIVQIPNKLGFHVLAPYTGKGYNPVGWAHLMGKIYTHAWRDEDGITKPPGILYLTPSSKGVKSKRKIVKWNPEDIDGAVRYVWLNTQQPNTQKQNPVTEEVRLRGFIQEVLSEAHYEQPLVVRAAKVTKNRKFRTYPDIDNWMVVDKWAVADTDKYGYYKVIYAPSSTFKDGSYVAEMGILKKGGGPWANFQKDRLTYFDKNGKSQKVDWDFNDEKNAVRYVYMQSQIPEETSESLNEIKSTTNIDIDGLPGWVARRMNATSYRDGYDNERVGAWDIYKKNVFGALNFVGRISDDGHLFMAYGSKTDKKRQDLVNDPTQAARTIFLHMQQQKEPLNEGRVKQDIEIPGLPGWRAQRYDETATGGNAWWSITNKSKYMGAIFDDGLLNISMMHIANSNHKNLANDPVQTARYMYLMMQPKKK